MGLRFKIPVAGTVTVSTEKSSDGLALCHMVGKDHEVRRYRPANP